MKLLFITVSWILLGTCLLLWDQHNSKVLLYFLMTLCILSVLWINHADWIFYRSKNKLKASFGEKTVYSIFGIFFLFQIDKEITVRGEILYMVLKYLLIVLTLIFSFLKIERVDSTTSQL